MNLQPFNPVEPKSAGRAWGSNHSAHLAGPPTNGHHKGAGASNHFDAPAAGRAYEAGAPGTGVNGAGSFERLLLEILTRLVGSSAVDAELEIEDALQRFCRVLGAEQAGLWRSTEEDRESFLLMHRCAPQCPPADEWPGKTAPVGGTRAKATSWLQRMPLGTGLKSCLPWVTAEVRRGNKVVFSRAADLPGEAAQDKAELSRFGECSGVIIPLRIRGEVLGTVGFWAGTPETVWPGQLVGRLEDVATVFAAAIACRVSDEAPTCSRAEIKVLRDRLQAERDYLRAESEAIHPHGAITGRAPGILRVLRQIEQVASADCPVLVSGETGTGKELVAQEIHRLSVRKDRAMVLVNCAALPTALVESELFGRERGAYTGALTSQVGRFEFANDSTIFLDEVGELPTEVQAKLLRVLQEGEFQRLGSPRMHKVNVRVIAATNRDLAEEVRKGRFREDLYYRLKVFPIEIPPLRERVEDIPLLAFAFMEEFSTRMGKKVTRIPRKAMEVLQAHAWQGNIRELRNVIEHSVILTAGDTLKLTALSEALTREAHPVTLAEVEREHILKTLESTSWRIKGPYGAAARLDLQPSTLYSRMQKLGIPHRRQKEKMSPSK